MLILAESAAGGRERDSEKAAHVGRITKILSRLHSNCVWFALQLLTKFITEDDLKAIQAKPFG